MPKYRVLQQSFIGGKLVEEGDEVEYDHGPGHNLEPICAEAKRRKKAFLESDYGTRAAPGDAGFITQMMANNGDPNVGMIPGPGHRTGRQSPAIYASDTAAPTE